MLSGRAYRRRDLLQAAERFGAANGLLPENAGGSARVSGTRAVRNAPGTNAKSAFRNNPAAAGCHGRTAESSPRARFARATRHDRFIRKIRSPDKDHCQNEPAGIA